MKGELDRIIMVYVDSYENGVPSGRFHITSDSEMQTFSSLSKLLIAINDKLDRENFPQSFAALRKFYAPLKPSDASKGALEQNRGSAATFSIRILFRQNASWQGSVKWLEGNQEVYFRSVLELIGLVDQALSFEKMTDN